MNNLGSIKSKSIQQQAIQNFQQEIENQQSYYLKGQFNQQSAYSLLHLLNTHAPSRKFQTAPQTLQEQRVVF